MFADLCKAKNALEAVEALNSCVATMVPLVNPDFEAAGNYRVTGRLFEIYIDASDFGWTCLVAQREKPHGAPRPIALYTRSFTEVQQRWSPMDREAHGLHAGLMEAERWTKGYKKFVFTGH